MRNRKRPPSHPGCILKAHYIEPLSLTITDLSRNLKVSRKTVSKIVNGRGAITSDIALRLGKAFGTTPELWLNLQTNYDLWHTANETKDWRSIEPIGIVAESSA